MNSKNHPSIFSGGHSYSMVPLGDDHKDSPAFARLKVVTVARDVSLNDDTGSKDQIIHSKPGMEM
jgi:hypothetical protein